MESKPSKKLEVKAKSKRMSKINPIILRGRIKTCIIKLIITIKTLRDRLIKYSSPKDLITKCTKPTETKAYQNDTRYWVWIAESKD